MSKLTEWLTYTSVPLGVWLAVITGYIKFSYATEWQEIFLFLPLITLLVFGLYATSVVLYRTFTFNDCDKEAAELKREIEEAKKDLQKKGILS
ncbi:PREDICTED: dolichol-phosphate mannosyltransferase subunit 3 [Polistes dominula]|uniref:Dolichol-phosphate mannosyltransferase subunit 3 n=1 Tax=Polistes dominula TaxID=743375 RepID=A0ABM1HXD7_POLDO|nr:PREDICTED: dolichol-phosphate mannosyltransferase subunit 3 [Polistes dominula]